MMKTNATSTQVNLLETANQIATTAISLQKKVTETGKPISIAAKTLLQKMPELEPLPADMILFRLRESGSTYSCDTLMAYASEDKVLLTQPDLQILTDFAFVRYQSGISGWADIQHASGLQLRVGMSVSDEHVTELVTLNKKGIEGNGEPKTQYLKQLPKPEIPIYSHLLPVNAVLTIIKHGDKSKKFDTPLIDAQSSEGEIFKNIICNAALERIIEAHGVGAKFKITGKRPKVNKDGKEIDSEGKVNSKNPAMIVQIADLQGLDFSDL